MDEWERDDDYEYGYDYLYEKEKPANAAEDADELDDDAWWDNESDEAEKKRLAGAKEADIEESAYWQDDEASDDTGAALSVEAVLKDTPIFSETEPQTEAERERHRLKRELKAEALTRFEEAARTAADFKQVTAIWDKLDATRERRERYNEVLREEGTLEYGRSGEGLIFPQWMMDATYRQLSRGNFLDYLADGPYEMHDLTGKVYLRKIVEGMKEDHKEIFFFLFLRQYSPRRLAAIRGQTDRNIRKVRNVILRKVRRKVYHELKRLNKYGYAMSDIERDFYNRYEEKGDKAK